MARNSARAQRFPAYYRHDLLTWRRQKMGLNFLEAAEISGVNRETVRRVFAGTATSKHVYPVAKSLGLDWLQVHNLKLKKSEFRQAVLDGNGNGKGPVRRSGEEEAGLLNGSAS